MALFLALGEEIPESVAICARIPDNVTAETLPEWIELFPAPVDGKIKARDGRVFLMSDPEAVVKRTIQANEDRDLIVDFDHSSEMPPAMLGGQPPSSRAAARFQAFEVRKGGAIWGKVAWTPSGSDALTSKEYKWISPGFRIDRSKADKKKGIAGEVVQITSAGLTNIPALKMTALASVAKSCHRCEAGDRSNNEDEMKLSKENLKKLGLPEDATEEQVNAALENLATEPSPTPKNQTAEVERLSKEKTELAAKVRTYEAELAKLRTEGLKAEADKVVETAKSEGKILPAQVDFFKEQCSSKDGLERVKKYLENAPVVAPPKDSQFANRTETPESDAAFKPSDEELEIARSMGYETEEDIKLFTEELRAQKKEHG